MKKDESLKAVCEKLERPCLKKRKEEKKEERDGGRKKWSELKEIDTNVVLGKISYDIK